MIANVYSIKDHKFIFGDPFISYDHSTAVRTFGRLVHGDDKMSDLAYSPADFDLFYIGTFDTESAKFDQIWPVEFIVNGSSL